MSALFAALLTVVSTLGSGPSPVGFAAEAKPWHYWMAPGIALVVVLATALMGLGYVVRVVLARYGVRLGRR